MIFFHVNSNLDSMLCKQTLETLIRFHILKHLIWICIACLCPSKRMLGLYGLRQFYQEIAQLLCFCLGNRLKELPASISGMGCLRMLDIRENQIKSLPGHLCNVRTLETLMLDAEQMTYPPAGNYVRKKKLNTACEKA